MTDFTWFENMPLHMQIRFLLNGYMSEFLKKQFISSKLLHKVSWKQINTMTLQKLYYKIMFLKQADCLIPEFIDKIKEDKIIKKISYKTESINTKHGQEILITLDLDKLDKKQQELLFGYFAVSGFEKYLKD